MRKIIFFINSLENKINLKNGRVRRVSIDKYQYYGITTEGYLIAIQKETNEIVWKSKLEGICRDISINTENGSVYVATEANFIYEISSLSGEIIHQRKFDHPVWALAYHPAGYLIAGTRRNYLYLFKDLKNDYLDCLEHFGNQKGLKVLHNNNILLNGNGYIKEFEINQNRLKEVKRWKEGLNTTCEDVILDVTHGFRHLPMLALVAARFLKKTKNINYNSSGFIDVIPFR